MLTGGRAAKEIYNSISKFNLLYNLENIDFYLSDERLVDINDKDSNYKMIKETLFKDVVTGMAVYFSGDNDIIQFKQVGTALFSDTEFEFTSTIEHRLMGPLYIEINYENDN